MEGDSFSVAFSEPVDALQFALGAQAALKAADWPPRLEEMADAATEVSLLFLALCFPPPSAKCHTAGGRSRVSCGWGVAGKTPPRRSPALVLIRAMKCFPGRRLFDIPG